MQAKNKTLAASVTPLKKSQAVAADVTSVIIKPPNMARATATLKSTAPYVQNHFHSRRQDEMAEKQKEGSAGKKTRRAKPPKDFEQGYQDSMHVSREGWYGIPCTAIRNAMIDACRLTEFDMIRAKMCLFIVSDGLDRDNLEPLIKITKGEPRNFITRTRIGINTTDLTPRAMFEEWEARVTIEWDADVFKTQDVFNLLARAGWQVGIGAGRPLSKTSAGTGKGTFEVQS